MFSLFECNVTKKELKNMRMGSSWKKDKGGMGVVTTAFPGAIELAAQVDLSVQNSVTNKARDPAWKIGDQAMKKGTVRITSPMTRGCLQ